jgi:hypothetical protein
MPKDEYVPRISVEVSEEQQIRFANAIPWGLRSRVLAILVEDLLSLVEKEGNIVIAALVERAIGIEEVVKLPRKEIESGT